MSEKEREVVHFSLGFGIFQNDDELMNGWNVSAAQAPYQGQNVEEVEEGIDEEAVEGEGVEVMEQQFSEGLHEEDNHLAGQCEMCQEALQHILSLEETNVLELREKVRIKGRSQKIKRENVGIFPKSAPSPPCLGIFSRFYRLFLGGLPC